MRLTSPTTKYAKSWYKAIKDLEAEKARGFWNVPKKPTNLEDYIKLAKDHSQGKNLPSYWVPATTYWLIDNNKFVGHSNLRHRLTKELKKVGGHIGYTIPPTERKKGYGTKILKLTLKKASLLGLKKVLITSLDDNIASQKIIEKNGGKLQDTNKTKEGLIRRYWIEL